MSIVITGNPGVGKHTITKKISEKLNFPIVDINIVAKDLELFEKTKNNVLRLVIPPSHGSKLIKYLENKHKYYVDWCGSLFWIEVQKNDRLWWC